jgi:reactive intermediate/imine deaminase
MPLRLDPGHRFAGKVPMNIRAAIAIGALMMTNPASARPTIEYSPRFSVNSQLLPYSSAVRVGDVFYLSGQMGFRDNGTLADGIEGQTRQAIENIRTVLAGAHLHLRDVFHCSVILTDMKQWSAFNRVYLEYFSEPLPTRSAFAANGLVLGGLVELECQAYAGTK